jgi:hypothetical protein
MRDVLVGIAIVALAVLVMAVGLAALFMGRTDVIRLMLCGLGLAGLTYFGHELVHVIRRSAAHARMARDLQAIVAAHRHWCGGE